MLNSLQLLEFTSQFDKTQSKVSLFWGTVVKAGVKLGDPEIPAPSYGLQNISSRSLGRGRVTGDMS